MILVNYEHTEFQRNSVSLKQAKLSGNFDIIDQTKYLHFYNHFGKNHNFYCLNCKNNDFDIFCG